MVTSFVREIEGATFRFNTVNVERLQLFQVYVLDQGVKKRFHMQMNEQGRFKIMAPSSCPVFCLALENTLHEAILENHAACLIPPTAAV